jgi:Fe-S cluster assembly protein SufD
LATATQQLSDYLEAFSVFEGRAVGSELQWLRQLRRDAFARFYEVGFPTTHDEDWRFTNLAPIARTPFRLKEPDEYAVVPSDLKRWSVPGVSCRLVFVDGHFARRLSSFGGISSEATARGLAEHITAAPDFVEQYLGRYLNCQRDSFAALNTAFADDGAFVHVPQGLDLGSPIHILNIVTANATPEMSHPRHLIIVGANAQAEIIEDYVSLRTGTALSNTATELIAEEGAKVSHYRLERENPYSYHVSTLRIQQARSAIVRTHSLLVGGALVRNNVHPVLSGEGGECLINGLFLGDEQQHLDNYMLVEHAAPHCSSRQFYNGVLARRARGVFHGRIIVHKAAQQTDAKQTNRNLLLSDDAQIDTKPQLEIYADDVKCTHGATIGKLEDDALFYLRARGIDEDAARRLLLVAFANECIERMKEGPVRNYIEALVRSRVEQMS